MTLWHVIGALGTAFTTLCACKVSIYGVPFVFPAVYTVQHIFFGECPCPMSIVRPLANKPLR